MKLLIITQKVDQNDPVLGFFISWIKALAHRVEAVEVICLAQGKYDLPNNVRVRSLGKEKGWPKLLQVIVFYYHLLSTLPGAGGVFVHMAPEYVRALYPLNFFFGKPVVMWYAHIKVSPVAKWAMKHVNFVLTPSKESFEINSEKVVATGHGIDVEVFKPLERSIEADILHIGRLSRVKKVETLIEAVAILIKKYSDLKVNIYGQPARPEDDKYFTELKEKVEKLALGNNIFWKGAVANNKTPEIYAAHKIFVRLQGGGGFGKVELEAMACGIPAIVPTPVYKTELGEFGTETYFNENDSVVLAERIESVMNWDDNKRRRYSELSRTLVVEKHNVQNVANNIVNLLKSCVE